MSRIFLSHSSFDEIEAVALKHWLADNGWGDEDVFLDVDPERGLAAGERWQEALRKAADRCEAVVFIVSPAWAKSKWCLAEFLLAKQLHKLIYGVVLKEVAIGELPTEMTSEWQLCLLVGDGPKETIQFAHRQQPQLVPFLVDGLNRLKLGLQKAGLNADFFPWPPKHDPDRAPYRGLQALDIDDAAIFFGRDVEILRGLDGLRGMRDSIDKKLFVILGASGAGKSSFLRAGLIPRLKRDDRHFLVLPVIRPQLEPLSGEYGLASSLHKARAELKLPPKNRGDILTELKQGPHKLAEHLKALQNAARNRLVSSADDAPVPTLVLPVDQAEELFNADAGQEAKDFLQSIGSMLRDKSGKQTLSAIVAFTIRSDRYEPLQTAPELAGLQSEVFDDLKPMPPDRFREVILGPAKRASVQGGKLEVKADLVNQLLEDCQIGGDPLPLLSLTLSTLHKDYGSDGDLRLDEYLTMGGITSIVNNEVDSILSTEPSVRKQQLESLHAAFIPWLATINPQNDQPMRRLAKLNDLPPESRPLILALAEKRLLSTDLRHGETVVEVAHEALLRQWDELAEWLRTEREDLKDADSLERATQAWLKNGRRNDWLLEGEHLINAETLVAKQGFGKLLASSEEFLKTARNRENTRQEAERQRQQAELEAARKLAEEQSARVKVETKRRNQIQIAFFISLMLLATASYYWYSSKQALRDATAMRLVAEGGAMTAGLRPGGTIKGLLKVLTGHRLSRSTNTDEALQTEYLKFRQLIFLREQSALITQVAVSPDGKRIVSGSRDKTLRLWDADTGLALGQPLTGHSDSVESVAFSPDGKRIVSGSDDTTLRLWNANTGQPVGKPLDGHSNWVFSVAVSPDGKRIVSGSNDTTLRLWDAETGQPVGQPLAGHSAGVNSVAFSRDGKRIVSGSGDKTLRLWPVFEGWVDELCKKIDRNMSHKEWREWVSPDIDYIKQCPDLPIPPDEPEATTAVTEKTQP